jgi:hypothetical protein
MSGIFAYVHIDYSNNYHHYFDGTVDTIGSTSVTLKLGTDNCNLIYSMRGYILIWDERTYEDSGIMTNNGCNPNLLLSTNAINFNSTDLLTSKIMLGMNKLWVICNK